jgi:hypothetical protein
MTNKIVDLHTISMSQIISLGKHPIHSTLAASVALANMHSIFFLYCQSRTTAYSFDGSNPISVTSLKIFMNVFSCM